MEVVIEVAKFQQIKKLAWRVKNKYYFRLSIKSLR
jgi:hypothetical protein